MQTPEPLLTTETEIETRATIEIRMGRGIRPEQQSYDALEVWQQHTH